MSCFVLDFLVVNGLIEVKTSEVGILLGLERLLWLMCIGLECGGMNRVCGDGKEMFIYTDYSDTVDLCFACYLDISSSVTQGVSVSIVHVR